MTDTDGTPCIRADPMSLAIKPNVYKFGFVIRIQGQAEIIIYTLASNQSMQRCNQCRLNSFSLNSSVKCA